MRKALDADGREAELSVTLVDDAEITRLNREYRGKDRPTDVISFSLGSPDQPLGDVYVGAEQARRQAEALAVPLSEELSVSRSTARCMCSGTTTPTAMTAFPAPCTCFRSSLSARS